MKLEEQLKKVNSELEFYRGKSEEELDQLKKLYERSNLVWPSRKMIFSSTASSRNGFPPRTTSSASNTKVLSKDQSTFAWSIENIWIRFKGHWRKK